MMSSDSNSPDGKKTDPDTFDWVQLKDDLDRDARGIKHKDKIGAREKTWAKIKENPLVPIGETTLVS